MANVTLREIDAQGPGSILEELSRRGAQQMLAQAMESEVALFIKKHAVSVRDILHGNPALSSDLRYELVYGSKAQYL